jgi:hypothetical protein
MTELTTCSFCGKSSDEVGRMVEGTNQANRRNLERICRDCARMAIDVLDQEAKRRSATLLPATNQTQP